ncbi:beta-galactosidase trimerization domain-containing protein [Devosia sp. A8/3-2]|nr:beta-galactosidase trimerization domain-containing protein [Devosia sp. A8/3-2]
MAILSSEYFHHAGDHNSTADAGAAQMLLELKIPFDVIDGTSEFSPYAVIILPDDIPVDGALAERLNAFVGQGGGLLLSGNSALGADGQFAVAAGICSEGPVTFTPSYIGLGDELRIFPDQNALCCLWHGPADRGAGRPCAGPSRAPYFNRTYAHFSSHAHAPDNTDAAPLGAAVTLSGRVGYIAYPIFGIYHNVGQPLYRHVVKALLSRLLPKPALSTDLPSAGRATLTHQAERNRHILHLLYGPPWYAARPCRTGRGPASWK